MIGTVVMDLVVLPAAPSTFNVYSCVGTTMEPRAGKFLCELAHTDTGWMIRRCESLPETDRIDNIRLALQIIRAWAHQPSVRWF